MAAPRSVTVVIETILLETDSPDLLLARDSVGTHYLCALVGTDAEGDSFLGVPISIERLAELRSGRMDLRSAFVDAETVLKYRGKHRRIDEIPIIHLEPLDEFLEATLPAEGFFLSVFADEAVTDDAVVREAVTRNTAVVVCALDPPEAASESRIDADRLAGAVKGFQNLVRHALTKAVAQTPPAWKLQFAGERSHVVQVVGFSAGSFRIHFQSKEPADLRGVSAVGLALSKIDELMTVLDVLRWSKSGHQALDVLHQNRGHVIAAYRSFLRFVRDEGVPFDYRWADPFMTAPRGRHIEPRAAALICELLDRSDELTTETVILAGQFVKVDQKRRTWTLIDLEQNEWSGRVQSGAEERLTGITIRARTYRVVCEERLEEFAVSGRQQSQLFLRSVDPIS